MIFTSIPETISGITRFSAKSSLKGKAYKDMSPEEQTAFKQLFLDAGAVAVIIEEDDKYEFIYEL